MPNFIYDFDPTNLEEKCLPITFPTWKSYYVIEGHKPIGPKYETSQDGESQEQIERYFASKLELLNLRHASAIIKIMAHAQGASKPTTPVSAVFRMISNDFLVKL